MLSTCQAQSKDPKGKAKWPLVMVVTVVIIITGPQWIWGHTVTEGRPTPCSCRVLWGSGEPGNREERARPDVRGHADEQRCRQMLLFTRLSSYRTSTAGNRGLQKERRACPGPHVPGAGGGGDTCVDQNPVLFPGGRGVTSWCSLPAPAPGRNLLKKQ